ncbi:MAG: glutathione-disulfide reductase [Limnobacter sp.]|nr:glutathione-disulfide reductase [Limnobacter sp.]
MDTLTYDLIAIGGGSGGVACARRAAALGAKVALLENDRLGGTCVIRGCVPKKLMMYAAQTGQLLHHQLPPGWQTGPAHFDMAVWQDAKRAEINRLEGIYSKLLTNSGVEVFHGKGKILSATQVQVNGQVLNGKRIVIATGSRPHMHGIPGLELAGTSDDVLNLDHLPQHIGIVGAGYIALEFACILKGLGAEVSVFYRGDLPLRGFDHDIRTRLEAALRQQHIHLHPNSLIHGLSRQGQRFELDTEQGKHTFDFVLNATGRLPNTQGLGLETLDVNTDAHGIIAVNPYSQTSLPGVFAIGDVTDRLNLTPVAIAEGRALAENEFNGGNVTVAHNQVATATFTSPPIGTVGLTETQAAAQGPVHVYETEFMPMRLGFAGGGVKTYMKLLACAKTDRILGAHMLGEDAAEMIQLISVAYQAKLTKKHFDQTVAVHPTSAEEWVLLRDKTRSSGTDS